MAKGSDNSGKKMFYTMGEAAEMLDVNPSLIRYWEGKFKVIKPKKGANGKRLFRPEDIENLKVIYHLVKEKGMTLAGAQHKMSAGYGRVRDEMEIVERLQSVKSILHEIGQELKNDNAKIITNAHLYATPFVDRAEVEEEKPALLDEEPLPLAGESETLDEETLLTEEGDEPSVEESLQVVDEEHVSLVEEPSQISKDESPSDIWLEYADEGSEEGFAEATDVFEDGCAPEQPDVLLADMIEMTAKYDPEDEPADPEELNIALELESSWRNSESEEDEPADEESKPAFYQQSLF